MILKNLKIWDGVSDQIDAGLDVIEIVDGRIKTLTSSDQVSGGQVAGKNQRDMSGLTLIPGLIDAHVHLCLDPEIKNPLDQITEKEPLLESMVQRAGKMLRAGITTARDLGGGNWIELELRDAIAKGKVVGPRLLCAGQPLTSIKGHCHFWGGEVANESEIETMIKRQVEKGVDLIKVMATGGMMTAGTDPSKAQFSQNLITKIVSESAKYNHHVAAHCHGTEGILFSARAGVRTIEHCSWIGADGRGKNYDEDAVVAMLKAGTSVSPTINKGWQRHIGKGEYEKVLHENFEKLKKAGVPLIASTDAGIPNVYHHHLPQALPVFAQLAELTNVEVLRTATSNNADALGLYDVTGRIAEGFSADFVLYDGNPLEDLAVLELPLEVYLKGNSVKGIFEADK